MDSEIPRYVAWSTDTINSADPWQRRWLLRQILIHGRAEDIRKLSIPEIIQELGTLDLPPEILRLWKSYLESRHGDG